MTGEAIVAAYVFILAIFVGFEVIAATRYASGMSASRVIGLCGSDAA